MRLALLLVPYAGGITTAIALWGEKARPMFFGTAAEVLALGAVAMGLNANMFRVRGSTDTRDAAVMVTILVAVGVGLAFAFGALARGDGGGRAHLAVVAGALTMGILAFAIQAVFAPERDDA